MNFISSRKERNRALSMFVAVVMMLSIVAFTPASAMASNLAEGNWVYENVTVVSSGPPGTPTTTTVTPTINWGLGAEKTQKAVFLPAKLGGLTITAIGNGSQNVISNNKVANSFILVPEGITTINARAFYDCNSLLGWSIPATVTKIDSNAILSCTATVYGEAGSAAQTYASASLGFKSYTADDSRKFTVSAGDNGYIQPNGTYYLPSAMLDGNTSADIKIVANQDYKIASVSIDGTTISALTVSGADTADTSDDAAADFETGVVREGIINDYVFTAASSEISVTFAAEAGDTRTFNTDFVYTAPAITSGAVAAGVSAPADANTYVPVNNGTTAKYTNTMGISTGAYYAADGKLYQMVYKSQSQTFPEYYSKAEVINDAYAYQAADNTVDPVIEGNNPFGAGKALVYGEDYDLIRLYNYYENVTAGPSTGEVLMYCTYLYKEVSDPTSINGATVNVGDYSTYKGSNPYINTAAIFAQKGANLTITDFTAKCYTASKGPSEAGNFFGMGSSIHVDGGDNKTAATNVMNTGTAYLGLVNPQVLGPVNSVYSAANGVINITGGNIFSCSSGGHGPYVSTGGQVFINTDGTGLVTDAGTINIADPVETARPDSSIGTMNRSGSGTSSDEMVGSFSKHAADITAIVTGDEAGTALATDTGGGMIVANRVAAKSYGLRCAGVYSIGSNESWVYCFNSTLTSGLDAGLCSASGGYIYADNCDIQGVMGIKARSGGNTAAGTDKTGIWVNNSRVSAYYDTTEMQKVYDVATPAEWTAWLAANGLTEANLSSISNKTEGLNIFLDKANTTKFTTGSLDYWFTDKSKTPGYSGGNKFAVIYVEGSVTPVNVKETMLVNQNYEEYGDPDTLADGQTPADNLLISVEGAGTGNVTFTNENSSTLWDKTGSSTETCELVGDFYIGKDSAGDPFGPNAGKTSPNYLNASLVNSEWEGKIIKVDGATGYATLNIDADSMWTVTGESAIGSLTVANGAIINAPIGYTLKATAAGTEVPVSSLYGTTTANVVLSIVFTPHFDTLTINSYDKELTIDDQLVTMFLNGIESEIRPGTYTNVDFALSEDYSSLAMGSYSGRGGEKYRAALYVDSTGVVADRSVTKAIKGGTYNGTEAKGISITSRSDNFNGVIVEGTEYTIKDSVFCFDSRSDGSDVSDFTGYGSVVSAFDDSKVTLDKVRIYTKGVARLSLLTDEGSDTMVKDSKIQVMGGTLYSSYVNTADQTKMVAPPWVLGITGNARTTNTIGTGSTTTVVRSNVSANQWGVLSTDAGSDMLLTVVDSDLTLLDRNPKDPYSKRYGSGYGTYIIGDAQEYFYGAQFNVGTYASILTGGDATYASSRFKAPMTVYALKQQPNGTYSTDFMGNTVENYDLVSDTTKPLFSGIRGLGRNTVINSEAFGFMAHNSGTLTITDGTVVNTNNAAFLLKAGDVGITVSDKAQLNVRDGVLLQMIDNDDSIVGATMGANGPNFNTTFSEKAGYPGIDYTVESSSSSEAGPGGPGGASAANNNTFTATDVKLFGNIYNGTGYFGGQKADKLSVNLGKKATLEGVISSTSIIHVNEKGIQNTSFTINEYWYLGHVANKNFYNGGNDIGVTLTDNAVWTVKGESIISSLAIGKNSKVQAAEGYTLKMTVNGTETKIEAGKTYTGKIVISPVKAAQKPGHGPKR